MYHYNISPVSKTCRLLIILAAGLLTVCVSCYEKEDYMPEESFIKIFNDQRFESSFIPMDLVQAGEDGYFILSASGAWNTYILRVDAEGNFMWDFFLDDSYVNPVKGLYYQDGIFYFFCMDYISLSTYRMKADDISQHAEVDHTYGDIIYPLHTSRVDNGYLVLSYNREDYSTRLSRLNDQFNVVWHKDYEVEQDVEEPIIGHLARIGTRQPFFTGQAGNRYFFNGFYNFSMSLLFVAASDGSQTGVINGFRDKAPLARQFI